MTVDPKIQNQQDVGFLSDSMSEILIELMLNLSRYIQSFMNRRIDCIFEWLSRDSVLSDSYLFIHSFIRGSSVLSALFYLLLIHSFIHSL